MKKKQNNPDFEDILNQLKIEVFEGSDLQKFYPSYKPLFDEHASTEKRGKNDGRNRK